MKSYLISWKSPHSRLLSDLVSSPDLISFTSHTTGSDISNNGRQRWFEVDDPFPNKRPWVFAMTHAPTTIVVSPTSFVDVADPVSGWGIEELHCGRHSYICLRRCHGGRRDQVGLLQSFPSFLWVISTRPNQFNMTMSSLACFFVFSWWLHSRYIQNQIRS